MKASDGKYYEIDVADTDQLFRLIQFWNKLYRETIIYK